MFKSHVRKELSAYLDDQLSAKMKAQVEKHLADCASCREELSRLKQISQQLKAWQTPDLGADFEQKVRNKIVLGELEKGEVKMEGKLTSKWIPSSALVALLLVVVLSGQFYFKRGWEGKLKTAADDMGEQFEPAKFTANYQLNSKSAVTRTKGGVLDFTAEQYEPYYTQRQAGAVSMDEWSRSSGAAMNTTVAPGESLGAEDGSLVVVYPALPATAQGEKVIRTAQITLEVADGTEAYKNAAQVCQDLGGYLSSSKFYKDDEGREAGTIVMRIPKDKFSAAQEQLSGLGKVVDISTDSRDVTQEFNSLEAQLKAVMVIYDKMIAEYNKKGLSVPETMRQEAAMTPTRVRVESLSARIAQLENLISFTTITLRFHEPKVSEKTLREARNIIKENTIVARINAIKFMAGIIPNIISIAAWVLIGGGALLALWSLIARSLKK